MKRWLSALALLVAGSYAQPAQAPVVRSYPWRHSPPPPVSPWVALGRGVGINPGLAYFSIVRPTMEAQRNLATIQQEMLNQQAFGAGNTTTAPVTTGVDTGHAVFLNYGHYF